MKCKNDPLDNEVCDEEAHLNEMTRHAETCDEDDGDWGEGWPLPYRETNASFY